MTPKQRLLVVLMPTVEAEVAAMVAEDKSWREIATAVSAKSGVVVSHESLRQWFGSSERVA